jgi:hypothetical protein
MSGHIADQAAGIASLPNDDPERTAAYDHASACPPCRRALHDAERLLSLLDAVPRPESPSEATMRRTWNAVVAEIDELEKRVGKEPRAMPGRWVAALAVAFSTFLVLFDAKGGALAWAVGVECLLIELGTAAVAVGVAARIAATSPDVGRAPSYAALAAWSAVVAQVYLHFRCPIGDQALHLVLFHLGGVLLAAILGGPFGARVARRTA